ncbi:hypothetical protein ALO40_200223 [Pseudomonas syringae pv. viburni]|uniref:Uncharacterized protein n=1 Tax=Pseudomonas syringae pv. viburni TaxID=251703 RepID=A0A0Q0G5P4_9PSED|nr:hypothetical protein ALO40_200223 [Pseudomonas syringae pv. viburni]
MVCNDSDGFIGMLKRLADELHIVVIDFHRLGTPHRFIVQDVDVALHPTADRVTYPLSKAEPARQSQDGQRLGHGFFGGRFTWRRAEVGT